jgi:hypothetical protein
MKATPIALTQHEVDAMITGGKAASAVRRRLAKQSPPKPARSTRKAEKAAPPPIKKKEMAAIQAARVPPNIRKRIAIPSPQPAACTKESLGPKLAPTVAPPKKK